MRDLPADQPAGPKNQEQEEENPLSDKSPDALPVQELARRLLVHEVPAVLSGQEHAVTHHLAEDPRPPLTEGFRGDGVVGVRGSDLAEPTDQSFPANRDHGCGAHEFRITLPRGLLQLEMGPLFGMDSPAGL